MKKIILRVIVAIAVICSSAIMFAACNKTDESTSGNKNDTVANDKNSNSSLNPLTSAYNSLIAVYPNASFCCELASDASFMSFDTNPYDLDDYYSAERMDMIQFINSTLNLPEYVYQDMITTRALDGKVSEESGSLRITWTYHPDKGLEILYRYVA